MTQQVDLANSKLKLLVDDDDFERVNKHIWMLIAYRPDMPLRAWARIDGDMVYLMHFVTNTTYDTHTIAFRNMNALDHRKANLLVAEGADPRFTRKKDRL